MMTAEAKKISFSSDNLVDQIVRRRKTASAEWLHRQGDLDEWDHALQVGSVYFVCDSARVPRCTIRLISIRLCQWSYIPEWLWRGEGNRSPEEFRADHLNYFENPGTEFEFVGFEFKLLQVLEEARP